MKNYEKIPEYLLEDNIHAQIISKLEEKLYSQNREITTEVKYSFIKKFGEIEKHEADIILIANKYAYAIEVKTSDTIKARLKVKEQLKADKKFLSEKGIKKILLFYAYQNKNQNLNNNKIYNMERLNL